MNDDSLCIFSSSKMFFTTNTIKILFLNTDALFHDIFFFRETKKVFWYTCGFYGIPKHSHGFISVQNHLLLGDLFRMYKNGYTFLSYFSNVSVVVVV